MRRWTNQSVRKAISGRSFYGTQCWYSPQLIRLDEGIEDRQELSHGCGQGHFFGFSFCQQTLVEGLDGAVPARGCERGHVQHGPHCRTTADRFSFAHGFSRIVVHWRDANEFRNLLTIELSEFRKLSDKGADSDRPNALHGIQDFDLACIGLVGLNRSVDLCFDGFQLFFSGFGPQS